MRISVVINTYNRARSLRDTLAGLERLDYGEFEVIVVNGPSTDETQSVLDSYSGRIRIASCAAINISKSRNIGIGLAAGELVAFIDDDAIPEPKWLRDLALEFEDERVAGAGGVVYDHTGMSYQFRGGVCDRLGDATVGVEGPYWPYTLPGSDPFLTLIGTNSCFRRGDLVAIGGFDEEIEYFLDETDVCARLIDSGREIRQIDGAPVHHRYLASHLRTERRIINNPYPIIKNRLYFGLHHGLRSHSLAEIVKSTRTRATEFHRYMTAGGSEEERANYRRVLDRAIDDGLARFGRGTRLTRDFRSPAPAAEFLPFPTRTPEGGKLVVCLVSQEIPPERYGGIARFTYDLACEFAEEGHEVHYVASCPDHDRVDYERSFWVHRVVTRDDPGVGLGKTSFVRMNILRSMAVHREIERIARDRRIDIVEAPIWDCEGFVSSLDDDLATVVSLQTTVKVMEQVNRIWRESPETASRIALERLSLEHAPYIHAISRAVLLSTEQDHAITFDRERCGLAMLGIPDPTRCARGPANAEVVSDHPAPIRVLFVGRIEPRKGTDLLLDAAVELLPEFSNLEFHLVGDHSIANERGSTDRAEFLEAHERSITDRVQFHGVVPESELHTHYERSDIFCAPSRFESFGLILLEAMAAGKPVVSCNVGGIPEVVADGENGILVAPGDSSALAGAIRRLILDPELRREMGKRSRVRFQESWSSQAMAGGVLAFYRRILRQRRSHAA